MSDSLTIAELNADDWQTYMIEKAERICEREKGVALDNFSIVWQELSKLLNGLGEFIEETYPTQRPLKEVLDNMDDAGSGIELQLRYAFDSKQLALRLAILNASREDIAKCLGEMELMTD